MINPPFNYTGSKFKLLDQILPLLDYNKEYFIDLFCGGGSVYTNVLDKYQKILINDILEELIGIHQKLAIEPYIFIEDVKKLAITKYNQQLYIDLRKSFNDNKTPEKLYSLLLTCTNNILRYNQKGEFNQTWGQRQFNDNIQKKLDIFVDHISKYKEKIIYTSKNFYEINPIKPSMIYCDPPYTNTLAGYNRYWNQTLEDKLYDYVKKLDKNGHSFALSGILGEHDNNKRAKIIDNLIADGFNYKILNFDYEGVARNKKSKNSQEILIYNYENNN
jgi:DNA adenine methylase Dam